MDDMSEKIQSLLSDEESMQQIRELAAMFGGTSDTSEARPESGQPQSDGEKQGEEQNDRNIQVDGQTEGEPQDRKVQHKRLGQSEVKSEGQPAQKADIFCQGCDKRADKNSGAN